MTAVISYRPSLARRASLTVSWDSKPFLSHSEADTQSWGYGLSQHLPRSGWVGIHGDLGVGKTFIARAIIQSRCGPHLTVASPSYLLVQTYSGQGFHMIHADFFRLRDPHDTSDLNLEEMMSDALLLVEWPERGYLHQPAFGHVHLTEDAVDSSLRWLQWTAAR